MKKALLIDGHSLTFRAFYSFPETLTLHQQPINAVFGFASFLFKAIESLTPDLVLVCFDRPEPTFRHALYDAYKGHRDAPPESLVQQLPILPHFLEELGVSTLSKSGFEADDLLGTMATQLAGEGVHATILTGDRDAYQLVNGSISVLITKRGISDLDLITPQVIQARYALTPHQLIDVKALQGDASDNIPGVPGIGEKTALKLVGQYGGLDGIYDRLEQVTPAHVQAKLQAGRNLAFMSQQLARIDCQVPVVMDTGSMAFNPHTPQVQETLQRYAFHRLMTHQPVVVEETVPSPSGHYEWVDDASVLAPHLERLKEGFSFDVETIGLTPIDTQWVALSVAYQPHHALVFPVVLGGGGQMGLFDTPVQTTHTVWEALKPLLADPTIPKYTHNGKFDMAVLTAHGVTVRGIAFDSLLAAFLLDPTQGVGLKELARRELGMSMQTFEQLPQPLHELPTEVLCQYAGADADATFQLMQRLKPRVDASTACRLFYDTELPFQGVLAAMELAGVSIDRPYLEGLRGAYSERLRTVTTTIHEMAGHPFSINSTKQLATVLYDELGIPSLKATKTGRSTDSDVLTELSETYPICKVLLTYRKIEKLMNTYVETLPVLVSPRTGRLHTHFNPVGAITGRLSSTKPNLQNIPIKDPDGLAIRGAFHSAFPSGRIMSADYSQIELRLMAHLSEDEAMIQAFHQQQDIHQLTASRLFRVPPDAVTSAQRSQAKAVNFGIIYGISAFGLARNTGLSRAEAKAMIEEYFAQFPGVKRWMDETIESARQDGAVWTVFGRCRPLPDIHSRNGANRQFAERTAINSRVQGTAADLIKIAMIRIHEQLVSRSLQSRLTIQVHDELVLDCVADEVDGVAELVKSEMEGVGSWRVPLVVDIGIGNNWKDV